MTKFHSKERAVESQFGDKSALALKASFTSKVTYKEEGLSLLVYLREKAKRSGKEVKRAVHLGACYINGKSERFASYRVQEGDSVILYADRFEKPKAAPLEVLYKDDYFTAWNKPAHLAWDKRFILHRLDKETSGVLLNSHEEAFFDLFRKREIEKIYLAVVEGTPKESSGVIENELGIIQEFEGQKIIGRVKSGGKYARTEWKCLKQKGGLSLIECRPQTGRMHQIRVHLASIDLPIVGDHQYNGFSEIRVDRMLLHAHQVKFLHPMTQELMTITAPIPKGFWD